MTLLLNCQDLCMSFGTRLLFKNLCVSFFAGERIGLIGPNGAGKSTLLKIIIGSEKAVSGIISAKRGLKIGYVPQDCQFPDISPMQVLLDALEKDPMPDYEKEQLASTWLSKLGFKGTEPSAALLSGGWKKRLTLAREIMLAPDLLLLDEPTNHLDLEGIIWLEKFLSREAPSYLLVSHDRYFLQNTTNRIIDINPVYPEGKLAINGSYLNFLEKKEEFLAGQLEQERSVASKARREQDWLRRSPKARTTKSQARIDDAHEILDELAGLRQRNRQKKAEIAFAATMRETHKLITAKNLSKSAGPRLLFQNLDFILSPGTRMGLMGPNGSGKTTLLKILSGVLDPDQGTLKKADDLKIVTFDQHRAQLPLHLTLREALSPNGDYITYLGQKIHVNGWCKRFLFSPDILDMPLSQLSGGERARILIAHLMLQPADILLLDEPTNDLDIPTLETFEESLIEFPGAVVLITHDRCMLDRICNTFLALGDPTQTELFPDYAQWEAAQKTIPTPKSNKEEPKLAPAKTKITYAEKKEFDQIEAKIPKLEAEVQELNQLLMSPEMAQDPKRLQEICTAVALLETQIETLYLRWEILSQKL